MSSIIFQDLLMEDQYNTILRQVWSHAALQAARSHSIMGVASMPIYKLTWQLLNDEQHNAIRETTLINEQYTQSWPGEPQDYKVWQDYATISQ
jgi:hypothetical protein